jgi:hypothetical protein
MELLQKFLLSLISIALAAALLVVVGLLVYLAVTAIITV